MGLRLLMSLMKKNNLFHDYSIKQLHSLVDQKEIQYLDLIEECIRKTESLGSRFHFWSSFDKKELFKQIDKNKTLSHLQNELLNIPVAVKDIFNTQILPTEMGSPIWKGFIAGNDARIVYNLKNAGAIIAGKTVTAEFAVHALNETVNPHDISLTPGTSSSGSAVSVALGICPLALASQTAGSLVRPASFNGIYGFKPSFGFLPRTGMLKTTDSLDTIGFFAAHYKDLLNVFDAIRVRGRNYPISHQALNDHKRQAKPLLRPWRVAFIKTYTWNEAEDYAQESVVEFVNKLSDLEGVEVDEINLPESFNQIHDIHSVIYNKALSYYFSKEYKSLDKMSDSMVTLIEKGKDLSPEEYYAAMSVQDKLCYEMDVIMENYDVLVSLSTSGIAPLREVQEKRDPALIWNTLHLPVVSVPVFVNEDGLPFGLQVCGRKYNDYLLLSFLDYLYERGVIPERMNPALDV